MRLAIAVALLVSALAMAGVEPSGTVAFSAGKIPFSPLASEEARSKFVEILSRPAGPPPGSSIQTMRRFYDDFNSALVVQMRARFDVLVKPETIGGVKVDVITPAQGISPINKTRVLINLHGGGFMWGAHNGGLVESIPIASIGKVKVISIDYREAPEYSFPAASEDVAAVYAALLKTYRSRDIGIYGGSAGGILAAESVAWFSTHGLPMPGAIGTFCASITDVQGDSSFVAPILTGQPITEKPLSLIDFPYFKASDLKDAMALPGNSPTLLAKFPSTLLISGSRDFALSSVLRSHALLVQANVDAELHVYEGMWHGFFAYPSLPESLAVYDVIVRFFDRHLGS
jgi:monoterpene epsilon-lactone hydrolase